MIALPFALPYFLANGRDLELIGLVLGFLFWFQMIRFCATHEIPSVEKVLWLAFMILVPGVGSLAYFLVRARPRRF